MEESSRSAHLDTFARDGLPPREWWPNIVGVPNYPTQLNCAAELLDGAISRGWGDRICVISGSERWTYSRLNDYANKIANLLSREMGLVPGNRVLLRGPNSPLLAALWFGVLKAGGVCVTTMPLLRQAELEHILEKARVSHAFCEQSFSEDLAAAKSSSPVLKHLITYTDGKSEQHNQSCDVSLEEIIEHQPSHHDPVITAATDVALIAFTSGTTGKSKGTVHFHRDVLTICDCWPVQILKPAADDIFCGTPHLAFTFGLGGLLLFPMRIGAATMLLPKSGPEELLAAIERHHASICFSSPTGYRAMASMASRHNLKSLRKCVSAGEVLPEATFRLWEESTGLSLIDGIGATEMLHIFISAADGNIRPGSTGKAVPPYEARIVDENGNPVPTGQIGLLQVRGPTGCRYLHDPDRQREYVRDGWNTTGDAYSQDSDGYFWFHARADDMIISSGYNISGHEVENALLQHEIVRECAVVGTPDPERGQIVKAYVVLKETPGECTTLVKQLQDFVKKQIAPYKYPRAIEFVPHLPRTETGKLQRFRLR